MLGGDLGAFIKSLDTKAVPVKYQDETGRPCSRIIAYSTNQVVSDKKKREVMWEGLSNAMHKMVQYGSSNPGLADDKAQMFNPDGEKNVKKFCGSFMTDIVAHFASNLHQSV